MASKSVQVRVEIDKKTDADFADWCEDEGRSKRRHIAVLVRKLTALRHSHPGDLARLGLLDAAASND